MKTAGKSKVVTGKPLSKRAVKVAALEAELNPVQEMWEKLNKELEAFSLEEAILRRGYDAGLAAVRVRSTPVRAEFEKVEKRNIKILQLLGRW